MHNLYYTIHRFEFTFYHGDRKFFSFVDRTRNSPVWIIKKKYVLQYVIRERETASEKDENRLSFDVENMNYVGSVWFERVVPSSWQVAPTQPIVVHVCCYRLQCMAAIIFVPYSFGMLATYIYVREQNSTIRLRL